MFLILPPKSNPLPVTKLLKAPPSNILIFSLPIYLLLFPFKNLPITHLLPHIFSNIPHQALFTTIIPVPFISPILSSII
ncbi:ArsB/NhaD family transporter, partial [Staphylococcus hominis]|uniref:ArsB/NhaD family transporter n=1 Tax=Staphylococcus hominis TaxID=1290 RepID=UPI0028D091E5